MNPPTLEEARDGLSIPDAARLKFCFDQGTPAVVKVKRFDGWWVGVHADQIPSMEVTTSEGCWSICRKREE